jgi:hypothetical protein
VARGSILDIVPASVFRIGFSTPVRTYPDAWLNCRLTRGIRKSRISFLLSGSLDASMRGIHGDRHSSERRTCACPREKVRS